MDGFVDIDNLPVLRVRADFSHGGPQGAFRTLESKLPTLRGRHFYGWAEADYFACVVRVPSDTAPVMPLEAGTIPGGLYVRRRVADWADHVSRFAEVEREMTRVYDHDESRPCLEHYRSQKEALLMIPIRSRRLTRATRTS